MKQFKIGTRVKIKSTGKTGMLAYRNTQKPDTYSVNLDEGGVMYDVLSDNLIRLRKKKKVVKQEEKAGAITREKLAEAWDKWIFSKSSESFAFIAICKEIGL